MEIFPLLALLPAAGLAGLACVLLAQSSLLPRNKLALITLVLAGISSAALVGLVINFVGVGDARWGEVAVSPAYSLVGVLRPAFLGVLLVGLLATTLTDLRERMVAKQIAFLPVAFALALAALNIPLANGNLLYNTFAPISVIVGALVCFAATFALGLFGRLWGHLRHVPPDLEWMEMEAEMETVPLSDFLFPLAGCALAGLAGGLAWASGTPLALALDWLATLGLAAWLVGPQRAKFFPEPPVIVPEAEMPVIEPDTGQDAPPTEAFGTGDVWLMVLVGALLGPAAGISALIVGIFINGFFALLFLLYDLITGRKEPRPIPMVPSLALGTLLVILILSH